MKRMSNQKISTIIVDADDTLWHNERHFHVAERRFLAALSPFAAENDVRSSLSKRGVANLDIYGYGARSFSLRSDVVPALEIGSWAAHIPHPLAWSHEKAVLPDAPERFRELTSLRELPEWIDEINRSQLPDKPSL